MPAFCIELMTVSIWLVTVVIGISHFGLFFALLFNRPENQNLKKRKICLWLLLFIGILMFIVYCH